MKKLLIICILIIGVIFISGCTNEEKTDTPLSSQNGQKSDTEPTDLILKSSDVSGFDTFSYRFYAVPKSTLFVCNNDSVKCLSGTPLHKLGAIGYPVVDYTDTLPLGYRNVEEDYFWKSKSGRSVSVNVIKFDSDPDSLLIETFANAKEKQFAAYKTLNELEKQDIGLDYNDPHIGDNSCFISMGTDIQRTGISFIHGTTYVSVEVVDEEDVSKETAMRISKIIESRLN